MLNKLEEVRKEGRGAGGEGKKEQERNTCLLEMSELHLKAMDQGREIDNIYHTMWCVLIVELI